MNENTILIATNNPGKAREYAELFGAYGLEVKTLKDFTEIPAILKTGKPLPKMHVKRPKR